MVAALGWPAQPTRVLEEILGESPTKSRVLGWSLHSDGGALSALPQGVLRP